MTTARRRSLLSVLGVLVLVALALALTRCGGSPSGTPTAGASTASRPGATRAPTTSPTRDPGTGLRVVALADLPRQAQDTVALIRRGGPYPYPGKDGSTYRNANGVLPRQPSGFYREYTVRTPGESDRGARRIVTGGDGDTLQLFYTDDHYDSFARVRAG